MLLSDVPELAAHHGPSTPAIIFQDEIITYAEMRDRCRRLANALTEVTRPGDRVAILAENCPEYVDCYYGVPAAALALTLLNYRLAPRELAYIIGNAEPRILVVEARYLPAIRQIRPQIPSVERILLIDGEAEDCQGFAGFRDRGAADEPGRRPEESDLCWLLYTSGTTGLPKGAMLSHRNLVAGVLNSMTSWEVGAREVAMFTFPMFHVAGYVMPMHHLRAYPVVLLRAFDPRTLLASVERHGVTNTAMAPTMLAMLLENPMTEGYDLSSLKRLSYGAAAMPGEVLRRARLRWPDLAFSTGFGMTELAGNVMHMGRLDHERAADADLPILRSVGREMPLARVRVADDKGEDAPAGSEGEILVKGDQVLSGYWRNPDATASAFTDGWFHTGDIGRWDEDRYLYIVDRKKDMILTGGENVYPREVEEVLFRHPAILEVAVLGAPDDTWGEMVAAVVCLRSGHEATGAQIADFCRGEIAGYKRPRRVGFIETLPKNASGKVLKRELRAMIAAGEISLEIL
jgi:acyl-CoA synthetase (AMP-forming)/AMP-acid ligase II